MSRKLPPHLPRTTRLVYGARLPHLPPPRPPRPHFTTRMVSPLPHINPPHLTPVTLPTIAPPLITHDTLSFSPGPLTHEYQRVGTWNTFSHPASVQHSQPILFPPTHPSRPMTYSLDVHAATPAVRELVLNNAPYNASSYQTPLNDAEHEELMHRLSAPASLWPPAFVQNFMTHYNISTHQLIDPHIPELNVSRVLLELFRMHEAKQIDDEHFRLTTLVDIGMTCIQGISHRLFSDHYMYTQK